MRSAVVHEVTLCDTHGEQVNTDVRPSDGVRGQTSRCVAIVNAEAVQKNVLH